MRRKLALVIVALVLLNCVLFGGAAYLLFNQGSAPLANDAPIAVTASPTRRVAITRPTSQATATVTPIAPKTSQAVATPLPNTDAPVLATSKDDALTQLTQINPPPNDRIRLAKEFKGVKPTFATAAAPRRYQVGDKETFWISRNLATSANQQIQATLKYMNDVVYMWVEDGVRVDLNGLKESADTFAREIYPTNRKFLGSEASPGVDNDPRLHILNAAFDGAAGYYSSPDTLPRQVNAQSNEHEMFYISTKALRPGQPLYDSVLAHEFAHMIHDNQNPRGESTWVTEGFGDLGMQLNNYQTGHEGAFIADPDLQLTAWGETPGLSISHYGAAYLFLAYQLNRFGIDYIRDLFATNTTGIPTIQRSLDKHEPGLTFDSVFADWVVANYITALTNDKRYRYRSDPLLQEPTVGYSQYPANGSDTVHQYGADYIELDPAGRDVTFAFDGSDNVPILPTGAHSGSYMWWSNNIDLSEVSLTRQVDLTGVSRATLKFWTWFNIEGNYDYAYVAASTDGGKLWQTLPGLTTTDTNPNASSFGNAYTCKSGVGCTDQPAEPQWIQEQMDLTPYAGQKVLIRFVQITDEAVTLDGMAVDDIEIPEIGFKDDGEQGVNGWDAEGFARIDNVLPQHFIVQAIEFGATPKVVQIPLDAENRASYKTNGLGSSISRVVIVISGSTPVTRQLAEYQYAIQ